jgi:hypothetical protein
MEFPMNWIRGWGLFYARMCSRHNRYLDAGAVVASLRRLASSLDGEPVGILEREIVREVNWQSLESDLEETDVCISDFLLSTRPRLCIGQTRTKLWGLEGTSAGLDWGIWMPQGEDWDLANRAFFEGIRESGAFWAEFNELRVTKKPTFCSLSGHYRGVPHLGCANYFGSVYVERLGGFVQIEQAGFAEVRRLGDGVYVRMPSVSDEYEFEECRARLEANLGTTPDVFDSGPKSPTTGEYDTWRVVPLGSRRPPSNADAEF